jgi:predicted DNA-binding ribbon-helix-helix protein
MELYRTQILLERSQHETLSQIAHEESRSLSEIVREMIDRELRYRQRRQMMSAARELQADYVSNPDLNEFSSLDSDDFLFEDDEDEQG